MSCRLILRHLSIMPPPVTQANVLRKGRVLLYLPLPAEHWDETAGLRKLSYRKPSLIRLVYTDPNMKYSIHSSVHTLKRLWDLGARGLSDCAEGSWRD
jgi:hypothetical protein